MSVHCLEVVHVCLGVSKVWFALVMYGSIWSTLLQSRHLCGVRFMYNCWPLYRCTAWTKQVRPYRAFWHSQQPPFLWWWPKSYVSPELNNSKSVFVSLITDEYRLELTSDFLYTSMLKNRWESFHTSWSWRLISVERLKIALGTVHTRRSFSFVVVRKKI